MDNKPVILLVDDDSTVRFLAREALEDEFVVEEASDGIAALEQARRHKPDLIMLDVQMPLMDGFEVCTHIRNDLTLMHVPILMATGLDDIASIETAYARGATNFIAKPIQWNTLPYEIRYVLRNSRLEEDLRATKARAEDQLTELKRENTERRRAEGELQVSEIRFRRLFETAQDGILLLDFETGQITDANATLVNMLGYRHSELLGQGLWDIGPFKGIPACRTALAELRAAEHIRCEHWSLKTRSGSALVVELVGNVYDVDDTKVVQCNFRDITERKHAESVLQASEAKFRGFLSASPDAMLVVDEGGRIVLASERIVSVFGYTPEELIGRPFDMLMPERYRATHAGQMRGYLSAPRPREMGVGLDLSAVRKDGSEFPTEISLSPHQTPEGLVVIAAIRDITVRKQAEAALQQAQKMEAVGQLTSGVAHDFNNVLGAVIGNLDLLADAIADNPKAAHYAESSLAAALSGAELVKRMLAFSRRQPLRPTPLDLRETIASVTPLIRRTISEQITIVESLADDLWLALADPSQIESAVLNLAINARDAMPEGGTLTIDCRNATVDEAYAPAYGADFRPGDYVVISLTDTGHGMAPEVAARAFDPFFTTKELGVGTGLGLSMVLGTMKQSGGTARIYSEPEHGTTVRLYLPRTTESKKSDNGRAIAGDAPSRGNERVLVVEDNERLREVSCAMLTGLGYRVETADGADEALARISGGERFDLVFSDVVMPGKHTGITLAGELRTLAPDLKIILTSGYTSPITLQDELGQLGIELIAKPFRKAELAALIRRVLDDEESP